MYIYSLIFFSHVAKMNVNPSKPSKKIKQSQKQTNKQKTLLADENCLLNLLLVMGPQWKTE